MRRGSGQGRQSIPEVILWALQWCLLFPIGCRDLELMLWDPGVN
jgi:hypothetical protein